MLISLLLFLVFDFAFAQSEDCQTIFINEFHYDDLFRDQQVNDFVEVAAPAGTDLEGWTIMTYDHPSRHICGNGVCELGAQFVGGDYYIDGQGQNVITCYRDCLPDAYPQKTFPAGSIVPDLQNGYGVLAMDFGDIIDGLVQNDLTNGFSDGILLVNPDGEVTQFIVYEGHQAGGADTFATDSPPLATTDIASVLTLLDNLYNLNLIQVSIQLQGEGRGCYSDFHWTGPGNTLGQSAADYFSTKGDINNLQVFWADPSTSPSTSPSVDPTAGPSVSPTVAPTKSPSTSPSTSPSVSPSTCPSVDPSVGPSTCPSVAPSVDPSLAPTTDSPSQLPTSDQPTTSPTKFPTFEEPSLSPSTEEPSVSPSVDPSVSPSTDPTVVPSVSPSTTPSTTPSVGPSVDPTTSPSVSPSTSPSTSPSVGPSVDPSTTPSVTPSTSPSTIPSVSPSVAPTVVPSVSPSTSPSVDPTRNPTSDQPTTSPSGSPTVGPSNAPTTDEPSTSPSVMPTNAPSSSIPSSSPTTDMPSVSPSCRPSFAPSVNPTVDPTVKPFRKPTVSPSSAQPTTSPETSIPSVSPTTDAPSTAPSSDQPTVAPTSFPTTDQPSLAPTSDEPSLSPTSDQPTVSPTIPPTFTQPSVSPSSEEPTVSPSLPPSSDSPSMAPSSSQPSTAPVTSQPTGFPTTDQPTAAPSMAPTTVAPSTSPSVNPTVVPTSSPSITACALSHHRIVGSDLIQMTDASNWNDADDQLTIVVQLPQKYTVTGIDMKGDSGSTLSFVSGQSDSYWSYTFDAEGCMHTYTFVSAWDDISQFATVTEESPSTFYYTGTVQITATETFQHDIDTEATYTRTVKEDLVWVLGLETTVDLAVNINVLISDASTFQVFDRLSVLRHDGVTSTVTIEYQTEVNYPWILATDQWDFIEETNGIPYVDKGALTELSRGSGCGAFGEYCVQNFRVEFEVTAVCDILGDWTVRHYATYESESQEFDFSAVVSLDSACGTTFNGAVTEATLTSYADSALTTVQNSFNIGDTSYFRVVVSDDLQSITSISLTDASLTQVILHEGNYLTDVRDGETELSLTELGSSDPTNRQIDFSLYLEPTLVKGGEDARVEARIEIEYVDRRRHLLADSEGRQFLFVQDAPRRMVLYVDTDNNLKVEHVISLRNHLYCIKDESTGEKSEINDIDQKPCEGNPEKSLTRRCTEQGWEAIVDQCGEILTQTENLTSESLNKDSTNGFTWEIIFFCLLATLLIGIAFLCYKHFSGPSIVTSGGPMLPKRTFMEDAATLDKVIVDMSGIEETKC